MASVRVVVHAALTRFSTTELGGDGGPMLARWALTRYQSQVLLHCLVDATARSIFRWASQAYREHDDREGRGVSWAAQVSGTALAQAGRHAAGHVDVSRGLF